MSQLLEEIWDNMNDISNLPKMCSGWSAEVASGSTSFSKNFDWEDSEGSDRGTIRGVVRLVEMKPPYITVFNLPGEVT